MFTCEIDQTIFQWHGGAYIDVGHEVVEACDFNMDGEAAYAPGDFRALDCMNVWNYRTDEPRIERTQEAFERECRDYITQAEGN
jgi:hypothetical protein